jgi:hypothetical protein
MYQSREASKKHWSSAKARNHFAANAARLKSRPDAFPA